MESNQLLSPFEIFDPLNGQPQHHYNIQSETLANRARRILKGRTREQIIFMVDSINFMFAKPTLLQSYIEEMKQEYREKRGDAPGLEGVMLEHDFEWDAKEPELGEKAGLPSFQHQSNTEHAWSTPGYTLLRLMNDFEISGQSEIPNAKWPEYFSALALALIGEAQLATKWSYQIEEQEAGIRELSTCCHIGDYIIDATEALGIAQLLQERELTAQISDEVTKEKIHLNNKKAAIHKNKDTNKIKRDFIRWCQESYIPALNHGERFNQTHAANEYYAEFLEEDAPDPAKDFEGAWKHKENKIRMLLKGWRLFNKTGELPAIPENL